AVSPGTADDDRRGRSRTAAVRTRWGHSMSHSALVPPPAEDPLPCRCLLRFVCDRRDQRGHRRSGTGTTVDLKEVCSELSEMDVTFDEARQHRPVLGIDQLSLSTLRRKDLLVRAHRDDLAAA